MCPQLCCQQRHQGWNSQNVCVKLNSSKGYPTLSHNLTFVYFTHSQALQLQLHSPLWTICPSTMTKKTSKCPPVLCIDMVIIAKLHTISPPDKIFGWDGSGTALESNKMVFCVVLNMNFLVCDNFQKEDKTYLVFILALTSKDSPNSHHLAPSPTTNKTSERQAF